MPFYPVARGALQDRMLTLNAPAPDFVLDGVLQNAVRRYSLGEFRGRWVVLFFYPADFTFVCPTEIVGFQRRLTEFTGADAVVLGISVDDIDTHRAWAVHLGGLDFPLLSDPGGAMCRVYGVLDNDAQRAFRATLIVAPDGRIAYVVASPMNVGRSVEETLRVLQGLQTGRLCPAEWVPGDPTLDPAGRY